MDTNAPRARLRSEDAFAFVTHARATTASDASDAMRIIPSTLGARAAAPTRGARDVRRTRRASNGILSTTRVVVSEAVCATPATRATVARPSGVRMASISSSRGARAATAATSGAAAAPGDATRENEGAFNLGARLRAITFFLTSFFLAVPLLIVMTILFPFCWAFDRTRRSALSFCNDVWATVSCALFMKIEVEGRENVPPADEAAVYVANHASFMDIYSMFHLRRPFKFISKTSNFLIPVIGWSMFLTGHVPLKRMERRSQMETLKKCRDMLGDGGSVLFFPEGTRSVTGKMAPFKKGAFSVAAKENVPVVPVTIVGAHEAMASGKEYELHNNSIKVIVHPRIQSTDAEVLCERSEKIIKEALVQHS